MIICDDPAFLFIHVPKAAGTSIAGVFAPVDLMRAAKARKEPGVRRQWIEAKGFPEEVLDLPIHVTAAAVCAPRGADKGLQGPVLKSEVGRKVCPSRSRQTSIHDL